MKKRKKNNGLQPALLLQKLQAVKPLSGEQVFHHLIAQSARQPKNDDAAGQNPRHAQEKAADGAIQRASHHLEKLPRNEKAHHLYHLEQQEQKRTPRPLAPHPGDKLGAALLGGKLRHAGQEKHAYEKHHAEKQQEKHKLYPAGPGGALLLRRGLPGGVCAGVVFVSRVVLAR